MKRTYVFIGLTLIALAVLQNLPLPTAPGYPPHDPTGTASGPVVKPIRMYVAYARYNISEALPAEVSLPKNWTCTVFVGKKPVGATITTGTLAGPDDVEPLANDKLPTRIECRGPDKSLALVADIVYSDEDGAWARFVNAWKGGYDIVLYTGHNDDGAFFDIGPKVTREDAGEHQGEPKNGYVVLMNAVQTTEVKLYAGMGCYTEIPYELLDSTCRRIQNHFGGSDKINAIGHRGAGLFETSNTEIATVITSVLTGVKIGDNTVSGRDLLLKLTAEHIGTADRHSADAVQDRLGKFTAAATLGATAQWHDGYGSAWIGKDANDPENPQEWQPYTEGAMIAGANPGDPEFDDVQVVPLWQATASADTKVVLPSGSPLVPESQKGPHNYIATYADSRNRRAYADPEHAADDDQPLAIEAGSAQKCFTTTTGPRQFFLRFKHDIADSLSFDNTSRNQRWRDWEWLIARDAARHTRRCQQLFAELYDGTVTHQQ
jgi:hypothetical protein